MSPISAVNHQTRSCLTGVGKWGLYVAPTGLRLSPTWLLVFLITIACAAFTNVLAPRLFNGFVAVYVVQPLAWIFLFVFVYRRWPGHGLGKKSLRPKLIRIALAIAVCQIYLMVLAGLLDKFGKSPNSLKPLGIVINIVFVASGLLGVEFSRNFLLKHLLRRPSGWVPVLIAFLFTALLLPWKQLPALNSGLEQIARFTGSIFFPLLAENLLASFLSMWGGVLPALAYRGTLAAFNWFCPVLPDLNWALKTLTGTLVPAMGVALVHEYCNLKTAPGKYRKEYRGKVINYAVMSAAAVVVIWFAMGVFPIRPLVIYSGSMRPTIDVGDIVITAKRNPELLYKGDIISFRVADSPIPTVHRVIDIRTEGKEKLFATKGDANSKPDNDLVLGDNVIGKVVLIIPKVGWASIVLREFFV